MTLKLRITCSTEDGEVLESDVVEFGLPTYPLALDRLLDNVAGEAGSLAKDAARTVIARAQREG